MHQSSKMGLGMRLECVQTLRLTYEGLVGGLREATLLVQQREHPHGLLQEEVQQRPVVLVLNEPGVHLLVQVLVLARETPDSCYFNSQKPASIRRTGSLSCW